MTYKDELQLTAQERGQSSEEVEASFTDWLKTHLGELWAANGGSLANWPHDDLADVFQQYYSASSRRSGSGGGGKGDTWVGMIVGYNGIRDNMRAQRQSAIDAAETNLSASLKHGFVYNSKNIGIGRAFFDNGNWVAVDSIDQRIHVEEAGTGPMPDWVIPINDGAANICLLRDDKKPKTAHIWKRSWLFVGNKLDSFLTEGPKKDVFALECSFDAAQVKLKMNVPILFKAEEKASWSNKDVMNLEANSIDPNYGLDWIPDEQLGKAQSMFAPDQYIAQFLPVVPLEDYMDHHDKAQNKIQLRNGGEIGPIFAVMGEVDYIQSDGREDPYAEGGFKHPIVLSNQNLKRENPSNSGVWINLTSAHVNDHQAHKVRKADGWHDYQQGSRVWCVVQTRTWIGNDGSIGYNMEGMNVYALPLRSIVSATPTVETNDVSQFDNFGSNQGEWE
tara:strand:+ start:3194 stop:4534 length:1341 start_codon:yes stop_codon:yes gene_type:complete